MRFPLNSLSSILESFFFIEITHGVLYSAPTSLNSHPFRSSDPGEKLSPSPCVFHLDFLDFIAVSGGK